MDELAEQAFWGDRLVKWPIDVVAKMHLAAEDAAYLVEAGLPTGPKWEFEIEPPAPGTEPERIDGMPILVYDYPTPLCISNADGGAIVYVNPTTRTRFVNSSVRQLGIFLRIYGRYRLFRDETVFEGEGTSGYKGGDDDHDDDDDDAGPRLPSAVTKAINDVEARMREEDPRAMADPNNFWSVIIEQMRYAFL